MGHQGGTKQGNLKRCLWGDARGVHPKENAGSSGRESGSDRCGTLRNPAQHISKGRNEGEVKSVSD